MQDHKTNTAKSAAGTVFKINAALLQSLFWGAMACWLWPDSRFAYGLGFLALVSVLVACAFIIGAILSMTKIYQRDTAIAAQLRLGAQPKSSTVVTNDTINDAGMRQ